MKREKGFASNTEQPNGARQKVMLLLIPVLAIVLWLLVRKPMAPAPVAAAETLANKVTPSSEMVEIDWQRPPVYQPSGRDPMQMAPPTFLEPDSAEPETKARVNITLRGILYSEDKSMAMIGANLVQEGQQVVGATIVKIEKDSVEFEMDGQRWKQMVSERATPSEPDTK